MSFPIDNQELKAAYYHLKDFGQESHAAAVKRFATQVKETGDLLIRMRRRILELEKEQPKASYEEVRNKDLERRTRNRPAANE
jgi:hypothetical protein